MDPQVEKNISTLTKAIKYKEVITFQYSDGQKYRVEPFCMGIHKTSKNYVIRCYCNNPYESKDNIENWRLFELDKMTEIRLSAVRIKDSRAGYTGRDKDM